MGVEALPDTCETYELLLLELERDCEDAEGMLELVGEGEPEGKMEIRN